MISNNWEQNLEILRDQIVSALVHTPSFSYKIGIKCWITATVGISRGLAPCPFRNLQWRPVHCIPAGRRNAVVKWFSMKMLMPMLSTLCCRTIAMTAIQYWSKLCFKTNRIGTVLLKVCAIKLNNTISNWMVLSLIRIKTLIEYIYVMQ